MGMYERTHSSLLKAAKSGNLTAEAWERFGVRYRPVLVRYCMKFYKLPHDLAENAVQETLVTMWQRPDLIYRPPNRKFRHVLTAVLRFKFLGINADERRQRKLSELNELPWLKTDYHELKATATRAFVAYSAEAFHDLIASGRWPDCKLDRDALEQWHTYTFEDATQEEIAADYAVDQSTVSRHIDEVETYLAKDGEPILGSFGIC